MSLRHPVLGALAVAAPLALVATAAPAHQVWLERDGAGPVRVYYGEPGYGAAEGGLREKTGGRLDRIAAPAPVGGPASGTERREDHVALSGLPAGDARVAEKEQRPYEDRARGGRSKAVFHAREGRAETEAALDLELVPVAAEGAEVTLLFRGQPVPKAEVVVVGPPGWTKSLRTGEDGRVTLPTPWAGRYVAEAVHFEPAPGEGYDRLHHITTLSFVARDGRSWAAAAR